MKMDKSAYEGLVKQDIEWLDKMMEEHSPHSLEGKHLRDIAICSVCLLYGDGIERMCPNPFCKQHSALNEYVPKTAETGTLPALID